MKIAKIIIIALNVCLTAAAAAGIFYLIKNTNKETYTVRFDTDGGTPVTELLHLFILLHEFFSGIPGSSFHIPDPPEYKTFLRRSRPEDTAVSRNGWDSHGHTYNRPHVQASHDRRNGHPAAMAEQPDCLFSLPYQQPGRYRQKPRWISAHMRHSWLPGRE